MLLRMAAVTLRVGTRKGAFALRVDAQRRHRGPAARPPRRACLKYLQSARRCIEA